MAREWELLSSLPVIHLLPGERQSDRIITHSEEDIYLTGAPELLSRFARVAVDTGMRPEEILRLCWQHVHFDPVGDARFGYLHNPNGKTKIARRNLPMTARVRSLLQEMHDGVGKPMLGPVFLGADKEPVTYNAIKCQHERVVRRLKMVKFRSTTSATRT